MKLNQDGLALIFAKTRSTVLFELRKNQVCPQEIRITFQQSLPREKTGLVAWI